MPRILIKKSDLPAAALSGAIVIRFRILSESRNTLSAFSPVYRIYPPIIDPDAVDIDFFDQGEVTNISLLSNITSLEPKRWTIDLNWQDNYNLPQYDIYVRWLYDTWTDWSFLDSVAQRAYAFDSPVVFDGEDQIIPNALDIAVTRTTYIKRYDLNGLNRTPLTVFNTVGHEHSLN